MTTQDRSGLAELLEPSCPRHSRTWRPVIYDDEANRVELAWHFMAFTADESSGKCIPCLVGSVQGREILERIQSDEGTAGDLMHPSDLGTTMKRASLCALGGRAPYPVETAIEHVGDEFRLGAKFPRHA
ncbi:MAG: NADH-ubiquinone oxidoreductase-F iron-sulfur binding region domain-containing protein [Nitrospiraceae bacterium]